MTAIAVPIDLTPVPIDLVALGARALTRAHPELARRPRARAEFQRALKAAQEQWKGLLKGELQILPRILEASFRPAESLGMQCAFVVLELSALGSRAVLELELPVLLALVSLLAGEKQASHAPLELTRLEQATVGYLVLVGLSGFRSVDMCEGICAPRLLSIQTSRREALAQLADEPHVGIGLSIRTGACIGGGRLLVPARALQNGLQRLPLEQDKGVAAEVKAARLSFQPRLGRTKLDASGVEALSVGDVVLLEDVLWDGSAVRGPVRLRGGKFQLEGELSLSGFTFSRARLHPRTQEHSVSSELTVLEPAHQLPVEVEIELTRLQMSLGELGELKPGAVLPLRVRASDPVLLRVGDRPVARAELVELGGEVGARILSLLAVD